MSDVSHVLELAAAKLYLLNHTVTNYQNYSHKIFRIDSELKPFLRVWALNGAGAYFTT